MVTLMDLLAAPAGELCVTVEMNACFSATARTLRVSWTATDGSLAVADGPPRGVARDEALAIARRLVEAAERPETPPIGRSTTTYAARLSWPGGQRTFVATEASRPEVVEHWLRDRPDLRAKLPPDLYARATGIHDLVEQIIREQ